MMHTCSRAGRVRSGAAGQGEGGQGGAGRRQVVATTVCCGSCRVAPRLRRSSQQPAHTHLLHALPPPCPAHPKPPAAALSPPPSSPSPPPWVPIAPPRRTDDGDAVGIPLWQPLLQHAAGRGQRLRKRRLGVAELLWHAVQVGGRQPHVLRERAVAVDDAQDAPGTPGVGAGDLCGCGGWWWRGDGVTCACASVRACGGGGGCHVHHGTRAMPRPLRPDPHRGGGGGRGKQPHTCHCTQPHPNPPTRNNPAGRRTCRAHGCVGRLRLRS